MFLRMMLLLKISSSGLSINDYIEEIFQYTNLKKKIFEWQPK